MVLGVAFRFAPVANAMRRRACGGAAAIVCAATLYRCLPEPAVHGHVKTAGPWMTADELKPYYALDEGGSCAPYLARGSALYWPAVDPDLDPTKPAEPWPPADTLGFLQLQTLGPVPPEIARLLPP